MAPLSLPIPDAPTIASWIKTIQDARTMATAAMTSLGKILRASDPPIFLPNEEYRRTPKLRFAPLVRSALEALPLLPNGTVLSGEQHQMTDGLATYEKMIATHVPLAREVSRWPCFSNRGLSKGALFSTAILGLTKAVENFNPTRKATFSTYATKHMITAIKMDLWKTTPSSLIPIPSSLLSPLRQLKRAKKSLSNLKNITSTALLHALARKTGKKSRTIKRHLALLKQRQEPMQHGEIAQRRMEQILDRRDEATTAPWHIDNARNIVGEIFGQESTLLTEREKLILWLRYGLDGQYPCDLESIGAGLQLTGEAIRQQQNAALDKIYRHIVTQYPEVARAPAIKFPFRHIVRQRQGRRQAS